MSNSDNSFAAGATLRAATGRPYFVQGGDLYTQETPEDELQPVCFWTQSIQQTGKTNRVRLHTDRVRQDGAVIFRTHYELGGAQKAFFWLPNRTAHTKDEEVPREHALRNLFDRLQTAIEETAGSGGLRLVSLSPRYKVANLLKSSPFAGHGSERNFDTVLADVQLPEELHGSSTVVLAATAPADSR